MDLTPRPWEDLRSSSKSRNTAVQKETAVTAHVKRRNLLLFGVGTAEFVRFYSTEIFWTLDRSGLPRCYVHKGHGHSGMHAPHIHWFIGTRRLWVSERYCAWEWSSIHCIQMQSSWSLTPETETDQLNHLNFHRLEAVCRYRDPQLQVGENYRYIFKLRRYIFISWCLNTHVNPNNSDLLIKRPWQCKG